jgi:hypothetical protein
MSPRGPGPGLPFDAAAQCLRLAPAVLVSNRFCWQPAPGLAPAPVRSADLHIVRWRIDRRFDRGCIRRDRSPNGVAWRCTELEGRGISRAAQCSGKPTLGGLLRRDAICLNTPAGAFAPFPDPFLGSASPDRPLPSGCRGLGPTPGVSEGFPLAVPKRHWRRR